MSNVIKIKGKLSGAPLLSDLQVREICFDMQTGHMYFKKDAVTLVGPFMANGGLGDMLKSIYDSNNNGKVDLAEDSEKLGGIIATNYATTTYVTPINVSGRVVKTFNARLPCAEELCS